MPKYIVERIIPGSGALTSQSLQKIARSSCEALSKLGAQVQWVESYITADKWFCIYIATDEDIIREHGKLGGFSINSINEVITRLDPVSAESIA